MSNIIKIDEVCKSCKGTGIYVGLAEKNGAGVVCHTCKGTGCHQWNYTYDDFLERKINRDIKRVYQINPGVVMCEGVDSSGKEFSLRDFGGMSYDDWSAGKSFPKRSENRKYVCPAWWYQSADYDKKPKWDECIGAGSFSGCSLFTAKEQCWRRWDTENGNGNEDENKHKRMIRVRDYKKVLYDYSL